MKQLLIKLIKIYQQFISPIFKQALGASCKYHMTCSEYSRLAIGEHGALKGLVLSSRRIVSCNSFDKLFLSIASLKNSLKTENYKLKIS